MLTNIKMTNIKVVNSKVININIKVKPDYKINKFYNLVSFFMHKHIIL